MKTSPKSAAGSQWPGNVEMPPAAAELRREVRDFLATELATGAFAPSCDVWLTGFSPEFSRKLGARGWLGMAWSTRYGGQARSALERHIVIEELLAAGAPVAAHWIADRQTGPLLVRYGTEAQRLRFLPTIARGECFFAIGMSESDAGSDLAAVRTRATPVEGGWAVEGRKVWTSHAHRSHFMITLCRTATVNDDRHQGLSQLIVDLAAPGVTIRPIRHLGGEHHFNEVILDEVFVPEAMVVGQVGDGWKQVTSELALERSGPERFLSTFPLLVELIRLTGSQPDARAAVEVGKLIAHLWTLRQLSLGVAGALDDGQDQAVQAALVKDLGTRFESQVIEVARLFGPGSATFDRLLRQAVLAAPGFTLRGGSSEILRGIVARSLGER